ncbi:MAG: hypothetical protein CR972_03065 [Candidatus Moraniibacteriota bacterium]|nr:MAG: hypothetical protein CR972_03065 [Candidatus Moranbacteria bacterium]
MGKVSILIDFSNINSAFGKLKIQKSLPYDMKIDYNKLVALLTRKGKEIVSKTVYLPTYPKQLHQYRFFNSLERNNFSIVTKEVKEIHTGHGTVRKANFDVEIAFDACAQIYRRDCNEIMLFSGDSDFAYLIENAKNFDFKITIVATRDSISTELDALADNVILLDDLNLGSFTFLENNVWKVA